MKKERETAVDIVLIHYPVLGKKGETIGSAVTNLDLHDIARTAKTYGVDNYYIVTPYEDQQRLVQEIIDHWQNGHGATSNPARKAAFELITISPTLEDVVDSVCEKRKKRPALVVTSARNQGKNISYGDAKTYIASGEPVLLLFGTAHGLTAEVTGHADYILPPIGGRTGYNHLSVRSAVSIILDRLLGIREDE